MGFQLQDSSLGWNPKLRVNKLKKLKANTKNTIESKSLSISENISSPSLVLAAVMETRVTWRNGAVRRT